MQNTTRRMLHIAGKIGKDEVVNQNGGAWANGIDTAMTGLRQKYPSAKTLEFQGSKAHQSSRDPTDKKMVLTAGIHTEKTRVASAHIHEDGTFKVWPSRAGRRESEQTEESTSKQ